MPMNYALVFGRNVRICRRLRRLSQLQFARRLEGRPSPSYISSIEHGKENPTLRQLVRFADALGMPLDALFDAKLSP